MRILLVKFGINKPFILNENRNIRIQLEDSICMTYKKIFNNILKRDIIIKSPKTFYMNNWTGPEPLCAY